MHHKRKGPKSTRAGCLLCKPHKRQGVLPRDLDMTFGDYRRNRVMREKLREAGLSDPGKLSPK